MFLIGAVGIEDRWSSVVDFVSTNLAGSSWISITPQRTAREDFYLPYEAVLPQRIEEARTAGLSVDEIMLMASTDEVVMRLETSLASASKSKSEVLLLDISCMPKRFFFPLIKLAKDIAVSQKMTLIACYTSAESYADELYSQAQQPAPLPLFDGGFEFMRNDVDLAMMSAGFQAHHVPQMLHKVPRVLVIVPFPPGPPHLHRCLYFVQKSLPNRKSAEIAAMVRYLPAKGCSQCFELLNLEAFSGERVLLLPMGPKPLSLAMALFAMSRGSVQAQYAQPTAYSPEYSRGIAMESDGSPSICGFVICYEGQWLY